MKILNTVFLFLIIIGLFTSYSCKKRTTTDYVIEVDTVYGSSKSDTSKAGYILLSPFTTPQDSGTLIMLDGIGNTIRQKRTAHGAMNFKRWVTNGQVRYTWSEFDPNAYVIPIINNVCFVNVIADSNLNEIKRVTLLPHNDILTDKAQGTDLHDFIYLADNHYITLSYYMKMATNIPDSLAAGGSGEVVFPVIQEILNDQVIFQWEGADFPEFYATSIEGNNFNQTYTPQDYMHLNSMIVDPTDNNLIVSCRNLNQVLKIDRQSGAIVWRLGGKNSDFPITPDQKFLRQHFASLTDNNQTLILFDNGDINERPSSRIVEFQLNQSAKAINGFRIYNIPEPFSQIMGDVQKFGSHYFIGGGSGRYFLDVNYLTGEKYKEIQIQQQSYRTLRYLE